jgi:heme exporter protein A
VLTAARPIWLLDEPTTALDAASQDRLRQVMYAHLSGGGLVVAATHGPLGLADASELRLGSAADRRGDPGEADYAPAATDAMP